MDKNKLKKLIDDFKKIDYKETAPEPTFMDISGYPHYENVCSNILQFYFNSEEAHQMKDLFIQALLKAAGEKTNHNIVVKDVIREQITDSGNRLDLVILTDEYVVGIENKIFAGLYNNLGDYSAYLNSIANGRKLVKIILSINKVSPNTAGFTNIKHTELFDAVDGLMGSYWQKANPKYLILLKDFMQTIRRMEVSTVMNNELMDFINVNQEEVKEFLKVIDDLKKTLRQNVQDLGSRIDYKSDHCRQWFYRENYGLSDDLVHDITVGDALVAIDAYNNPSGWRIEIWLRKTGTNQLTNISDLRSWLLGKGISNDEIINDNNRAVFGKDFSNMDETAKCLQELLDKLCN